MSSFSIKKTVNIPSTWERIANCCTLYQHKYLNPSLCPTYSFINICLPQHPLTMFVSKLTWHACTLAVLGRHTHEGSCLSIEPSPLNCCSPVPQDQLGREDVMRAVRQWGMTAVCFMRGVPLLVLWNQAEGFVFWPWRTEKVFFAFWTETSLVFQLNILHTELAKQLANTMVLPIIQFREKDLTGKYWLDSSRFLFLLIFY